MPDPLVGRLKVQAIRHRRSLNLEVIASLEAVAQAVPVDPDALLARARMVRQRPVRLRLTDQMLTALKSHGRS